MQALENREYLLFSLNNWVKFSCDSRKVFFVAAAFTSSQEIRSVSCRLQSVDRELNWQENSWVISTLKSRTEHKMYLLWWPENSGVIYFNFEISLNCDCW